VFDSKKNAFKNPDFQNPQVPNVVVIRNLEVGRESGVLEAGAEKIGL
jgi:hypothetical protein